MRLLCAFAGAFVLCVGCKQGDGDRCQVDSDCGSGLVCRQTGSPGNGICKSSNPGEGTIVGGTDQDAAVSESDAASDDSTAEAASDGSDLAADAAAGVDAVLVTDAAASGDATDDSAARVDVLVAADDATVGADAVLDAEAADGPPTAD